MWGEERQTDRDRETEIQKYAQRERNDERTESGKKSWRERGIHRQRELVLGF